MTDAVIALLIAFRLTLFIDRPSSNLITTISSLVAFSLKLSSETGYTFIFC